MSIISVIETFSPLNGEPWTTTFTFPEAPTTETLTATFTRDNGEVYTTEVPYDPFGRMRPTISTSRPSLVAKTSKPSATPMKETTDLAGKEATPTLKNGAYLTTISSIDFIASYDWDTVAETKTFYDIRTETVTPPITLFTKSEADVLTTPFVFPPQCTALPSLCERESCTARRLGDSCEAAPSTGTLLCVDKMERNWAACQPRLQTMDWVYKTMPTIENYYTSAVCPSDWVALDLGLNLRYLGEGRKSTKDNGKVEYYYTISTAWCCPSGHSLEGDTLKIYGDRYRGYSTVCVQSWGGPTPSARTVTGGVETPLALTTGTAIYPPWHVEWVSPDVPSLSPQWPTLTSNMLIPTWTPGMSIKKGEYDNKGTFKPYRSSADKDGDGWVDSDKDAQNAALQSMIMKIVLPILFVGGLMLVTCWAGCRKARKARKQRTREARENAAPGDGGEAGREAGGAAEWMREVLADARAGKEDVRKEARETVTGVAKVSGGAPV